MHKIIVRNKKYILFVIIVLLVGIITGIIYSFLLGQDVKLSIIDTLENIKGYNHNYILKDIVIMSILLVAAFFVIGIPLSIFYLYYEGISIGFILSSFFMTFNTKGILYGLLYLLINRFITFILIIIFIKRIINIGRYIIGFIIYKKDSLIKEKLLSNFIKSLYIIVFTFIINILIFFFSPF